jgi:hypothetical protein
MSLSSEQQRERWRINTRKYQQTKKGQMTNRCKSSKYKVSHPEKIKAHRLVEYALKTKKIVRPSFCEINYDCNGRIEAHHTDYLQPLKVTWLCVKHHKKAQTYYVAP